MNTPGSGSVASCDVEFVVKIISTDLDMSEFTHPLHAVCWRDLTKHPVVIQDGGVCGVIELWVVSRGTKVELVVLLSDGV